MQWLFTIKKCNGYFEIIQLYNDYSIRYNNYKQESIVLKNIDSLEEINLNCTFKLKARQLFLVPNAEILIHNSLNITDFLNTFIFAHYSPIYIYRAKGFNYDTNKILKPSMDNIELILGHSKFNFYMNRTFIDESFCNNFSNFEHKKSNFFAHVKSLNLDTGILYSKSTCPYVFINSNIERLTISQISNSLILKNQLGFVNINKNDYSNYKFLLNPNFYFLNIGIVFEHLSLTILNTDAFKNVRHLYIWGILYSIQTDLFSNFQYLNFICLDLENLKQLLHNSNGWLKYINSNIKVDFNNISDVNNKLINTVILQINLKDGRIDNPDRKTVFNRVYLFPDEDFCLFKDFPHYNLVYPIFSSSLKIECTCTVLWLIQFSKYYLNTNYSDYKISFYNLNSIFFDLPFKARDCVDSLKRVGQCEFNKRLENCNKSTFSQMSESLSLDNDLEVFFLIKWTQLIILEFLLPIFSLIGIITNLITIKVLRNNMNSAEMKDEMYKHIFVNALFNLFYCMITFLRVVNVCIFDLSIFCSSVYQYSSSQYFKIIFVYFVGNALKLCINVSYVSFSLCRFMLSSTKTNKLLKMYEKLNLVWFYLVVVVLSCLISGFKLFEYRLNEIYNSSKSFPFQIYDIGNCNLSDRYCYLFRALNFVNDFIKDIFFFFINLIIDIFLFRKVKRNLDKKIKISQNDTAKISQANKTKNKINQMVILNGIVFCVAYFPECVTNILLIGFDKRLNIFCLSMSV
jgi:hypothetical protein